MHPPGRTRWSAPLSSPPPTAIFRRIVARALLAGDPSPEAITARLTETLGRSWRFLPPLARRYSKAFAGQTRPRLRAVVLFLAEDEPFRNACKGHAVQLARWTTEPTQMSPAPAARTWPVPPLETVALLAAWLELTPTELAWFADRRHLAAKVATPPADVSKLHHYHYRILAKPGQSSLRLIETPKPRLKHLQRRILHEILDRISAHPSAHGFVASRSIATFAAPHTGRAVVLRMDLQDFFPTFSLARVQGLFRTAGYPEQVADLLAALCTNAAPGSLWRTHTSPLPAQALHAARTLYTTPHLPQGAPTSPALANALTYRVDCRLTALAHAAGATYTRYADDLAFSGPLPFARRGAGFSLHVAKLLHEEGFAVNHRKTRIMRAAVRQHLAGVVVNQRLNLRRPAYDRLKAVLTNCLRHGPASQLRALDTFAAEPGLRKPASSQPDAIPNLRAHLEGHIAHLHMLNPTRAAKLRRLFDQILWV